MKALLRLSVIVAVSFFLLVGTAWAQWISGGANYYVPSPIGVGGSAAGSSVPLFVAVNGLPLSGTAFYGFRVGNAAASQGLLLGYDTSANIGLISTVGPGSVVAFWTHNGVDYGERARIDGSGNFGIGTTTPGAKLDVNGAVNVNGNIAAKYQDFAEWVPASSPLDAGTVVVLSPDKNNEVTASSKPYDTSVAGVVTAQPGLILGEPSASKEKIATSGRVRVHADASRAPIRIGDLLVTSSLSGRAMRSEPVDIGGIPIHRPGTILGKALEPLPSGHGDILVLLTLQ